MGDLIDRQAALDALRNAENHAFNAYYKGLVRAHKIIAELPSAQPELESADVIPVVRCKDCGWAMKSMELPGWYMCKCEEAFDYYAKPDDFCSHGKKEG